VLKSPFVKQETNPKPVPGGWNDSQIAGLVAQTGCLVVSFVLVMVFAGIWLDRVLNTRPMLTLLLVLGSMPFSIYILMRIAQRAVAKNRPLPARADRKQDDSEDDT
jgi:F0F1-type ATP synthase assembly protein I